jgi:hypothetical protein
LLIVAAVQQVFFVDAFAVRTIGDASAFVAAAFAAAIASWRLFP